jgi:hypothetical protein
MLLTQTSSATYSRSEWLLLAISNLVGPTSWLQGQHPGLNPRAGPCFSQHIAKELNNKQKNKYLLHESRLVLARHCLALHVSRATVD